MADEDQLTTSLQESILTLIVFSDTHGAAVASIVTPELFEPPYRDIAARALEYRVRYGKAPGKSHVDDLFDHVLEDPKNKLANTYRRLLSAMVELSANINGEYVASRTTEFVRRQSLKAGVLRAADRYRVGGDDLAEDVERILLDTIRDNTQKLDPGLFLNERKRSLGFLDHVNDGFATGIKELDRWQLIPQRKELDLFLAPMKKGKTWRLVHYGKQCFLQRGKVCHISLEMSEDKVAQRYYQNLFAMAKRPDEFTRTIFEFDSLKRLEGFRTEKARPTLNLKDPDIRRQLGKKLDEWGMRLGDLLIKQFPTKALTVAKLRSYLDSLDTVHHFTPDMLIIDYPDLMYTDPKNPRLGLGRIMEELRGIAVERNLSLVAAKQVNREGIKAGKVMEYHVAEDISAIATADLITTYSQTSDEKILGLARLFVAAARNDEDKFNILITQNYKTGQFVLDSTLMTSRYWDQLKEKVGRLEEEEDLEDGAGGFDGR